MCQSQSVFLPTFRHEKYNKDETNRYGIQSLELDFLCVCPLVSNQICTNFHCTNMIKYEINNILNVPTPLISLLRL